MDRESEYLLHLLGAYIREEEPEIRPDTDWDKLFRLAHIHAVPGILGNMVMSWDLCADRKNDAFAREICMSTIAGFAHRGALADLFLERLAESGIDHIVMKGYVLKDYYPVPELRTFGDIDMVIRPEDRKKCHERMLALGYPVKTDWEPVYSYKRPDEYYEIHTELVEVDVSPKADYRSYFRDPWRHAVPAGHHRYQLRPEYHFLYLLVHLAKHMKGSGAGVRLYLDLAAFIRHFGGSPDWNWVAGELEKLGLTDFAAVILAFIQRYFGIESPLALPSVAEELLEELAAYTVSGGVFGQDDRDSGTNTLKAEKTDAPRFAVVLKRLFPAAKTIESRYTYLQGRPWLLPVAWIHRLFRTKDTWGQHALEAKDILEADTEAVRKIRRLYEKIGL